MSRPRLPIGIQSFAKIRQGGFAYVDKTAHAWRLAGQAGVFFLSRPRRFGKSLFLDTLHQLFACRRELFSGLYIEDKWDWDTPHPVIRISFGSGPSRTPEQLTGKFEEQLRNASRDLGVRCGYAFDDPRCFADLIRRTCEHYQRQVVVLVDEYDKPILDRIEEPGSALVLRDMLRDFYSVLKEADPYLRFVFLTGVSKFSRVSIFSGLNNLEDLTIHPDFAAICGYTQSELEEIFSTWLDGVDMSEVKRWYNGYAWLGEPVYNPFDILLFLSQDKRFRPYWFETGSPSFLVRLFQENRYFLPELEGISASDELLSSFDVDNIDPVTLLWQTGYLTIRDAQAVLDGYEYRLAFPNHEGRVSLNKTLLAAYAGSNVARNLRAGLYQALSGGDTAGIGGAVERLFSAIPYRNFSAIDLAAYEGYYASVLYAFFSSLGLSVIPEDISNHGQADLTVRAPGHVYVMEVKVVEEEEVSGNPALEQIRARGYAGKYAGEPGVEVHCLGLVFSRAARNLVAFDASGA